MVVDYSYTIIQAFGGKVTLKKNYVDFCTFLPFTPYPMHKKVFANQSYYCNNSITRTFLGGVLHAQQPILSIKNNGISGTCGKFQILISPQPRHFRVYHSGFPGNFSSQFFFYQKLIQFLLHMVL
jgi:hypothetical protein